MAARYACGQPQEFQFQCVVKTNTASIKFLVSYMVNINIAMTVILWKRKIRESKKIAIIIYVVVQKNVVIQRVYGCLRSLKDKGFVLMSIIQSTCCL